MLCAADMDGWPEFFRKSTVKARKPHRCEECGYEIKIGEAYQYCCGLWEGIFSAYRTCERCADLMESFRELGYCFYFGAFFEQYGEDFLDDPARANAIRDKHRNWEG